MIIDIIDGLTAPPFAYQPPRHEPTQRTSFPSFPYQITPKPFENLNFYQTNAYRPYLNPFSASPSPNSPDYQYFRPTVATPLKPPPPQNPQKEEQNGLNTQQFVTNNYKNINNIKFVPNPSNFNNNKPLTFPQRDPVTPAPQVNPKKKFSHFLPANKKNTYLKKKQNKIPAFFLQNNEILGKETFYTKARKLRVSKKIKK